MAGCSERDLAVRSEGDFEVNASGFQHLPVEGQWCLRAVCVEEGWPSYGVTAELAARIQKACFDDLDAPVERVGMAEVLLPYAKNLETIALPCTDRIAAAALGTVGEAA